MTFLARNGRSQEYFVAMMDWAILLIHNYTTSFWLRTQLIDQTSPSEFRARPLFPRIMCSPLSLVFLTPIFPTPNIITFFPFYTLLSMESSRWQNLPHECGTHWFRGQSDHLGLEHCSSLSNQLLEVGPSLLTLRGLLSNLCLTPVRCSGVSLSLGLLVSLAEVMDLNIGSSPTLPILMPSIISRMSLLISSAQLWNGPMTFPTTATIFLL